MSLNVEDGSIVAGAESYISVVDADTYHSNRANAAWALLSTSVKEASLRKATDYMQQVYRLKWKGTRAGTTQSLDWPRLGVYVEDVSFSKFAFYVPVNTVPVEVKNACASLALTASTADLAPDIDREVISEKIGPIQTDYRAGAPQYKKYRSIDLMLKIYLEETAISSRLVRA